MHVELIEPRRLMAATGLDTTFANNGTLDLGEGVTRSGTPLSTANALYVGATQGDQGYIYKFNANGKIDKNFGDDGRAAIGIRPQKLAVDKKSGTVFAAGERPGEITGNIEGVYVARVNADGTTDKNYGAASGAYVPTLGSYFYIGTQVEGLYTLPNGKLLVAASVQTAVNDFGSTDEVDFGIHDLTLVQFNAAGKRDGDYGRRGLRTIYSAFSRNDTRGENTSVQTNDAPQFADAQVASDGSARVIFTHEKTRSVTNFGKDKNIVKITGEAFVESRNVSADGDTTTAYRTWSLGKTKPSDARDTNPRNLNVLTAQAVGDTNVRAFAIRDSLKPLVYTLTKDNTTAGSKTPTPVTLSLPSTGAIDNLAGRIGVVPLMGGYYITNLSGGAVKNTARNAIDRTFADNGIATLEGNDIADYRTYTADAQGRLLVLTQDAIRRVSDA